MECIGLYETKVNINMMNKFVGRLEGYPALHHVIGKCPLSLMQWWRWRRGGGFQWRVSFILNYIVRAKVARKVIMGVGWLTTGQFHSLVYGMRCSKQQWFLHSNCTIYPYITLRNEQYHDGKWWEIIFKHWYLISELRLHTFKPICKV